MSWMNGRTPMRAWRLPLLLLAFGSHQAALAQLDPAFARLVKDPREQKMVTDAARLSSVVLEHRCAEARYTILDKLSVVEPLMFDKSTGDLRSGSWRQVIKYTGCGVTRVLNVLVSAAAPSIGARPLLPGTTLAGPQLQVDVFKSPALQLRIDRWRDPGCTFAYVANTAFVDYGSAPVSGTARHSWQEVWTLAACDRTDSVTITFAPDATGTSFHLEAGPPDSPRDPAVLPAS
jgi:hypothetical protein